jgi:hypothetical protein
MPGRLDAYISTYLCHPDWPIIERHRCQPDAHVVALRNRSSRPLHREVLMTVEKIQRADRKIPLGLP